MAHVFKTPLDSMDDKQKEWFATAMVSMVLADGNVAQGEVESLLGSLSFIKQPDVGERLKKFLAHKTMPNLNAFSGWNKKPKARALLLIDLLEVAIADRELSPTEREHFHHLGELLGFTRAQVQQFLETGVHALQHVE